jgi:hypothetical protein
MWREPSDAEIAQLESGPHAMAIISALWETHEYRRGVAPLLSERALDTFSIFFPGWTDKYLELCDDLRKGVLPDGASRRPVDIVFLAYILCLHRPPDPLGFVQYTDQLARGAIDAATVVKSLLASSEAAAVLVSDPSENAQTIAEFAACLKHKSSSAECVL